MKKEEGKEATPGTKIWVFFGLEEGPTGYVVVAGDTLYDLRKEIKAEFSKQCSHCDPSELIVQTKDAGNILHPLENAKLKLGVVLERDKDGDFNVYVTVPPSDKETVIAPFLSSLDTLSNYLLLSPHIQLTQEWKDVDKKIEECAKDPSQPFILLDGPSGVGKTQLALSQRRKSIYLLLTAPQSERSQPVYKPFLAQTLRLLSEIKEDISRLLGLGVQTFDMPTILPGEGYFTLGYLARLWKELDRHKTGGWPMRQALLDFRFQSVMMSIEEFRKCCPNFLLLLDETPFVGKDAEKKRLVKFIRNLTRKVGVAVLLGTDSTLSNIVDRCGSRGDELAKTWCHVFTGYPPATNNSLKIWCPDIEDWVKGKYCSKPLTDFLNYVIKTHRPWLAKLFLSSLKESIGKKTDLEILQGACSKVGNTIMQAKRERAGEMWFVGQKRLPLCIYRAAKRPLVDHLAHGHMAYLGLPKHAKSVTLELQHDALVCDGKPFKPFAYFPSAANEALLYLGLLQSPLTDAFTSPTHRRMATCHAYETPSDTSFEVDLANSQAIKRSGDQYEVILAVGMIVASHEAWLSGQTVSSFLPRLFYEVCGVQAKLSKSCAATVNKRFRERKIGYLSPISSAWPKEVVKFPEALVATPCRPPDKKRFDLDCKPGDEDVKFESEDEEEEMKEKDEEDEGYEDEDEEYKKEEDEEEEDEEEEDEEAEETQVMVRLTGEAKNRKNKFSLSEMVERIPDESELHVVLGYAIVKQPRATTRKIIRDRNALLVRLVRNGGEWCFESVLNLYKAKHLVILIDKTEIEQTLKRKT